MNTAAVETRRGTVWRKPSLLWTEQSTVSLDMVGGVSLAVRRLQRSSLWPRLTSRRSRRGVGSGCHGDHHSHAEGGRRHRLHGRRVRRWGGSLWMSKRRASEGVTKTRTTNDELFFPSFYSSTCKAQTATSKESLLRSAWMCHLLTAQSPRSSSPPWSPTLRWAGPGWNYNWHLAALARRDSAVFPQPYVCLLAQYKRRSGW